MAAKEGTALIYHPIIFHLHSLEMTASVGYNILTQKTTWSEKRITASHDTPGSIPGTAWLANFFSRRLLGSVPSPSGVYFLDSS